MLPVHRKLESSNDAPPADGRDRAKADKHLASATAMYREMGMTFWLEKAEAARGHPLGTHPEPGRAPTLISKACCLVLIDRLRSARRRGLAGSRCTSRSPLAGERVPERGSGGQAARGSPPHEEMSLAKLWHPEGRGIEPPNPRTRSPDAPAPCQPPADRKGSPGAPPMARTTTSPVLRQNRVRLARWMSVVV